VPTSLCYRLLPSFLPRLLTCVCSATSDVKTVPLPTFHRSRTDHLETSALSPRATAVANKACKPLTTFSSPSTYITYLDDSDRLVLYLIACAGICFPNQRALMQLVSYPHQVLRSGRIRPYSTSCSRGHRERCKPIDCVRLMCSVRKT
jgi:hypothetical protein